MLQIDDVGCDAGREEEQRWLDLQASDSEDGNQSDLLSASEIQAPDDGDGQDDQRKVRDYIDPSIGTVAPISVLKRQTTMTWTYNHMANWLMHVACSRVQNARTGTQAKILLKTVQMV